MVDDDSALRVVLGRALVRCGYEVFLAENGVTALAALALDPGVAAVVSDIAMPAMTGTALATEVLVRHPGVPVLFVTGSPGDATLLAHPLVRLLEKPVRAAEIRRVLADLIAYAETGVAVGEALGRHQSPVSATGDGPLVASGGPAARG